MSPLTRFILRVLAWLPVTFAIWYFAAPLLVWPAAWLARGIAVLAFDDIVRGVEQVRAVLVFATSLRAGFGARGPATIAVEVNTLLYAFGLPLFAALTLAAREPRRLRVLLIGYAAIVPVIVWGTLADFLKNVAITSGAVVASQTGFTAGQREVIAFAFQFGSLILPTVIPAIVWVMTHRLFLLRVREAPPLQETRPAPAGPGGVDGR